MNELNKFNAEVIAKMRKSHFQAELDVSVRHITPMYETLSVAMDQHHKKHIYKLQVGFTLRLRVHAFAFYFYSYSRENLILSVFHISA